jgi:hypothetical protein
MKQHIIIAFLFMGSVLPSLPIHAKSDPLKAKISKTKLKLDKAAKKFAAKMEPVGETHLGYLEKSTSKRIKIQIDRARCYKFVAVGGNEVTNLSITVNAHGKEVASDRISGDTPAVEWCSPGRLKAFVALTIHGDKGDTFGLRVYGEKDEVTKTAQPIGGTDKSFISNRIRQMYGQFGKNRRPSSAVLKGNLSTGKKKNYEIKLDAGHCYTILSAGNPSVRNLDILLFDPENRNLERDESKNSFPILETQPCIRASGKHVIQIYMHTGFGQFGFQIFSD